MSIEAINEEWRDVAGYDGDYQVSNLGRVKSTKKWRGDKSCRILSGYTKNDYPVVSLGRPRKEFYVHRLVATCFLGHNNGMEVNHKDGDKANNQLTNLEWVSHSENILHAYQMGKCHRRHLKGKPARNAMPVLAINGPAIMEFTSVTQCAGYIHAAEFNVRRRVNTNKQINGYLIYSI